jgi:hypothetical protein
MKYMLMFAFALFVVMAVGLQRKAATAVARPNEANVVLEAPHPQLGDTLEGSPAHVASAITMALNRAGFSHHPDGAMNQLWGPAKNNPNRYLAYAVARPDDPANSDLRMVAVYTSRIDAQHTGVRVEAVLARRDENGVWREASQATDLEREMLWQVHTALGK